MLEYLKNVTTLRMDPSLCVHCGMCSNVCPREVFRFAEGACVIRNRDACMECGACARNCPSGALTVLTGVGCAAAHLRRRKGTSDCGCEGPCC